MAEKELAILLTAKNMASGGIKAVTKDIGTLDKVAGRAGKGVRTLGSNLKNMAIGAGIGIVVGGLAAIKSGLDSLAERENVISATNAAIRAQGKDAVVTAGQVRDWSEELERATGAAVDDKAIQASANTIIRTGATSEESFKRVLAAAVDLGAGLKTGPEAGAKTLALALADPVKGMTKLRKAGIILNESEQKRIKDLVKGNKVQEAQNVLLTAVEKRYKGAAAASAGPYQKALNLLADAQEDAKMALAEGFLPVLEKVADRLSTALSDKGTIQSIRDIGNAAAGFFDKAIDFGAQIPWGSIRDAMSLAGKGAKAAFDLFTGLPPWVQTAVVTGWGLNKLTGGAVGGIIGELGKGLIKGVLGMNAGVVNINAGVVNGAGGIGGAAAGAAGAAAGIGTGAALGIIGAGVAASVLSTADLLSKTTQQQRIDNGGTRAFNYQTGGIFANQNKPMPVTLMGKSGGTSLGDRDDTRSAAFAGILSRATATGLKPTVDQIQRTYENNMDRQSEAIFAATAMRQDIVSAVKEVTAAVRGIKLTVSAGDIQSRIGDRNRTVKPAGPRKQYQGSHGG